MPSHFLVEQMEWREALDDVSSPQALDDLKSLVHEKKTALLAAISLEIDEKKDYAAAASLVRQLMFVEKFVTDLTAD